MLQMFQPLGERRRMEQNQIIPTQSQEPHSGSILQMFQLLRENEDGAELDHSNQIPRAPVKAQTPARFQIPRQVQITLQMQALREIQTLMQDHAQAPMQIEVEVPAPTQVPLGDTCQVGPRIGAGS